MDWTLKPWAKINPSFLKLLSHIFLSQLCKNNEYRKLIPKKSVITVTNSVIQKSLELVYMRNLEKCSFMG
jgi:hypothetical protein